MRRKNSVSQYLQPCEVNAVHRQILLTTRVDNMVHGLLLTTVEQWQSVCRWHKKWSPDFSHETRTNEKVKRYNALAFAAGFPLSYSYIYLYMLLSTGSDSCHKGFRDVRQNGGGLEMSWCSGQLSWARAFATSLSVAAYLRRAGGSMLARTGSHGSAVGRRVPHGALCIQVMLVDMNHK